MKSNMLMPLSGALALIFMSAASAENSSSVTDKCRILKQESSLCPSIQYLTNVENIPFKAFLQNWVVFSHRVWVLYRKLFVSLSYQSVKANLRWPFLDSLFSPLFNSRWALSESVQEPNCVSFQDHGLGTAPIDNIKVVNDLGGQSVDQAGDRAEEKRSLIEERDGGLLFSEEENDNENENDLVKSTLEARHLSRRERVKHHHHHHSHQQKDHHSHQEKSHHHHHEKRGADHPAGGVETKVAELDAETAPKIAIRADQAHEQVVYSVSPEKGGAAGGAGVLIHETLGHPETNKGQQKALVQAGTESKNPAAAAGSLAKASAGQFNAKNATDSADDQDEATNPHKGTVLLAVVPILLLMGAIAGFTVYRRYYENSFNEGGRNDTRDDYPTDGYYRRDVPIRKGSPIHFDRTFLNTVHSPPPTATYLHDPENSSRNQSPSSIASVSMKRPPPSASSFGKTRLQELSRSYDFGAGFRTIKNALTRSNNNSREGALDKASGPSGSGSSSSLPGRSIDYAFGAGGHSIAKIGSHPGLNALERRQLQQQYGAGTGSAGYRFPDMNTLTVPQDQSIIWGQYSANDDGIYQDAASAVASNLARKSASNSLSHLSGGKYSHHHQQSSGHQPDTSADNTGDCLSPESPSMTRAEMMRRRALYAEGYTFGSEKSPGDDAHLGTDLLFDARDNFFDLGSEKVHEAALTLRDEEMDMYLSMEKEESPYTLDDYNTMNPSPYEPKVLSRRVVDTSMIQKTAVLSEKEYYPSRPSLDRPDEEFDEKKALEAENQAIVSSATTEPQVPEETHVLGCASPEWTASEDLGHIERNKQAPVTGVFDQVQATLNSFNDNSGMKAVEPIAAEPLDLREWEEEASTDSIAPATQMSGAQQSQGQSKKKGNKSKAKKGRKY
ncbi:hypothetical protein BGX26_000424 [Mortierella sp. AD094]|nr:hypothetical protein BGX26_000424 [Mortierella sp. AD094]